MKKNIKISIITIALSMFCASFSYAATGTINIPAARMRTSANTSSELITNIYEDEKVEVLTVEGEWLKIKYDNKEGYIKKDFIKESKTIESSLGTTITENPVTNSNNVSESKLVTTKIAYVKNVPSFVSNTVLSISVGTEINVTNEVNNWLKITDGNVNGWILKSATNYDLINNNIETAPSESKIETAPEIPQVPQTPEPETKPQEQSGNVGKRAVIKVETAKVRKSNSTSSEVIGFLDYNDVILIEAQEGEWYKFTSNEISGYVNSTLVRIPDDQTTVTSRSLAEPRKVEEKIEEQVQENIDTTTVDESLNASLTQNLASASNGSAVVDFAKQYLGYSYVVGGKTPQSGFDCSGFTKYVFSNFGYTLGSTAASQNDVGTEVSRDSLIPGDLILFYDEGITRIGHVGIYIGNGEFIHSANPKRGVVIDNLNTNSYYNTRYVSARRIVN